MNCKTEHIQTQSSELANWLSSGSVLAALGANLTCSVPLMAAMAGVTGLGWLTKFSWLRTPLMVIAVGLAVVVICKIVGGGKKNCVRGRGHRVSVALMSISLALLVFEFWLLPVIFSV